VRVSSRTRLSPTWSSRPWTSPWFSSNQNVPYQLDRNYADVASAGMVSWCLLLIVVVRPRMLYRSRHDVKNIRSAARRVVSRVCHDSDDVPWLLRVRLPPPPLIVCRSEAIFRETARLTTRSRWAHIITRRRSPNDGPTRSRSGTCRSAPPRRARSRSVCVTHPRGRPARPACITRPTRRSMQVRPYLACSASISDRPGLAVSDRD
jgi:hypothetical protein